MNKLFIHQPSTINHKLFKLSTINHKLLDKRGFSLVEILVSLTIFSVILSLVYLAYTTQIRTTTREYRVAEAEIEIGIARNIIERDLNAAGYGLADDYSAATAPAFTAPRAACASNGTPSSPLTSCAGGASVDTPDTLTLMGTALGLNSRQAQGWTYAATAAPTFQVWNDAREDVSQNDEVVLMEPSTKKLLSQGGNWRFQYNGVGAAPNVVGDTANTINPSIGTLVYGLAGQGGGAQQPFYAVRYYLGGTPPSNCAPGAVSLLRRESRTDIATSNAGSVGPVLDCVLDMEVAFGLDTNDDGTLDQWDNGGVQAATYDSQILKKRLKQIRMYILVQSGNLDTAYTSLANIRVGDQNLGTGRDVPIAQRNYRWRLLTIEVTPRNIR